MSLWSPVKGSIDINVYKESAAGSDFAFDNHNKREFWSNFDCQRDVEKFIMKLTLGIGIYLIDMLHIFLICFVKLVLVYIKLQLKDKPSSDTLYSLLCPDT